MANDCLPHVQACAMRVARLEPNGVPDPGANNLYVSNALSLLVVTPVYEDGDEIRQKNACGEVVVNYRDDDSLLRFDVQLTILTPDPELMEMLSGGATMTSGDAVGWKSPAIGKITGNGISIELWSKRIDDGVLDAGFPYARWVLTRVKNLRMGEFRFENGPVVPQFTGQAYENDNWFDGPLNDWTGDDDRAFAFMPDTGIPTASCGYQTIAAS